ncbi:RdRp catalytic domain-containing protein, partial [Durusdinium trenchii]
CQPGYLQYPVSAIWCCLLNVLFVVTPLYVILENGGSLKQLGLWRPDIGDVGYQMILSWFFAARILKLAPDTAFKKEERSRVLTQIAWNLSTVWKWFFTYCWIQNSTAIRSGNVVGFVASCAFFTLFHVGTQDVEYLKRAWMANAFFAVPFGFFGAAVIWPFAAGCGGAVGTLSNQRIFTLEDVMVQVIGLASALWLGFFYANYSGPPPL